MTKKKIRKIAAVLAASAVVLAILGWEFRKEIRFLQLQLIRQENILSVRELTNFELDDGKEFKLINSAIKQNYNIHFEGDILTFDTLIIGKGDKSYCSSYLKITKDSVFVFKITKNTDKTAYKHSLQMKNNLIVDIDRKVDSAYLSIVNEQDTFIIVSDFIGMENPFVRSVGSKIQARTFSFTCKDYNNDVYIFGDSYISVSNPARWTYYIHNEGHNFFCDGLPGGKSMHSYDFLRTALTVHKPKYVVWCLGMNDGSDHLWFSAIAWSFYLKRVMQLCEQQNITLILATVPNCPKVDNRNKNDFVRKSGYRYIDFDKALSDDKGNYLKSMFSDGVHPTEEGAKKLAERFLADFSEIKE
jgi:hypothetical protein